MDAILSMKVEIAHVSAAEIRMKAASPPERRTGGIELCTAKVALT
jgi:hypothetical protein